MVVTLFNIAVAALVAAQTPWITVRTNDGVSWFERDGHPFWSFGVDCVEDGVSPAQNSQTNPTYSGLSLFPNEQAWVAGVQGQLKSWGFNTLGAWSDAESFRKYGGPGRLPYAVCLHLGSYDKAPWHDLFSSEMKQAMEGAARDQIPKYRSDPYLIGYFSDNELGWWDDTLFISYLNLPMRSPGRHVMSSFLKAAYRGSFENLKADWITDAPDFDLIKDLKLRPGGEGRSVIKKWTQVLAEQYYKLAHDLIRAYDPDHLILGDRYCQYYSVPVVKASAKYVDVVSTNLGADWNDGSITPFYLDTLHKMTGKPVMVTEFYMAAKENRSGDKNSSGGFPTVQTQAERADAFARYVREVAATPCTVGAHWFQYFDEPGNGRGDGENYNMGLVDIKGKPYEELTEAAAGANPEQIHALRLPGALSREVPKGPDNPMAGLKAWNRDEGWVGPGSGDGVADLYTCVKPEGLYIGLYSMDFADKSLYPGGTIPEQDRCHLSVQLNGQPKIDVRFGDDDPTTMHGPDGCKVVSSGGLKESTILFIPNSALPSSRSLRLTAGFETHGRGDRMSWDATLEVPVVR